jgi:hypothetical protein
MLPALLVIFALMTSCHGDGSHASLVRPNVLVLQVGGPMLDTVFIGGFNAYAVSVRPGATYKISMTAPTDDVDLLFYGGDSTYTFPAGCSINNTGIIGVSPEDCVVTAKGSVLYFGADGTYLWYQSAAYTIDVEELTTSSLGASTVVHKSSTILSAGLFSMPVTTGNSYTAAIAGLNGDASLYVFDDGDFAAQTPCSIDNTLYTGTTPEDCTVVANSGGLFLIVDPIFSSVPTVQYTAFAAPSPAIAVPTDEGSIAAPVPMGLDSPSVGQTGFNGTSYYSAPVTTAGSQYTISITGLTGNANLTVYGNDATFTTPAPCIRNNTFFSGTTPEDCTLTAAGNILYFTVTANTASGGVAYFNLVSPNP